MSVSIVR